MPRRLKVTLSDVARAAGVSLGTASQALSGSGRVSEASRQRVQQAANGLGYSHRSRRVRSATKNIGFILVRIGEYATVQQSPFYGVILSGVEKEARALGFNLVFSAQVSDTNEAIPQFAFDGSVDGVVVAGVSEESHLSQFQRGRTPVVLVDNVVEQPKLYSIVADNVGGADAAVSHLINTGHRKIALISGPEKHYSIDERRDGYLKAHRRAGLEVRDELYCGGDLTFQGGYEAMVSLIDSGASFDSVFCCNDETAIGALRACHERGISVPRDVSVVGFDDIELSAHVFPALTTVRVHKEYMGRLAVRYLVEVLRTPAKETPEHSVRVQVETNLVVRDSTAPRS
ncbi:MAG: LacI family transcriptional regulator [Firmicutes bacterium]|nr:LacI family transcriptional regulator [Bacillota bacterium]